MDLTAWASIIGAAAGVTGVAVAVAAAVGRPLRRLSRQNDEFRLDWYGEQARPGRAAVPGVPERLTRIEAELKPNGGGSLRDAVNRLEHRLDEHLKAHSGGAS